MGDARAVVTGDVAVVGAIQTDADLTLEGRAIELGSDVGAVDLTIAARDGLALNNADVTATGDAVLSAASLTSIGSGEWTLGTLRTDTSGDTRIDQRISATQVTIDGAHIDLAGGLIADNASVTATGQLSLGATTVTADGDATGTLVIQATDSVLVSADLTAEVLTLSAGGDFIVSGQLTTDQVTASASDDLELFGASLTEGQLSAGADMRLGLVSDFANLTLNAGGNLDTLANGRLSGSQLAINADQAGSETSALELAVDRLTAELNQAT